MSSQILLSIIGVLLAANGYFIKRVLDRIDRISDDVTDLKIDMADIKPKVNLLWEHHMRVLEK